MRPRLITTVAEMRTAVAGRANLALVPTMGALHAGHGALMDAARREAATVVASIFVNPIQFDRRDDYEAYARTLDTDLDFCAARGVDMVFAPTADQMYPAPQKAFVEVAGVSERLCGEFRPGHFRGVATVVMKLFQIVRPDIAYFGRKDAQQLAVIRRMVADLNVPVKIVGIPIVREPDGLALSSRNRRLSPEERRAAPALHRAIEAARRKIDEGCTEPAAVIEAGRAVLRAEPQIRSEYFEVVDAAEMQPVGKISAPVLVAAAVWLSSTRLIDNG